MFKVATELAGSVLSEVENHAIKRAKREEAPTIEKAYVLCNEIIEQAHNIYGEAMKQLVAHAALNSLSQADKETLIDDVKQGVGHEFIRTSRPKGLPNRVMGKLLQTAVDNERGMTSELGGLYMYLKTLRALACRSALKSAHQVSGYSRKEVKSLAQRIIQEAMKDYFEKAQQKIASLSSEAYPDEQLKTWATDLMLREARNIGTWEEGLLSELRQILRGKLSSA